MKSFVSFIKSTKDSLVNTSQNLFGKKKDTPIQQTQENSNICSPNQNNNAIFDEETCIQMLNKQDYKYLKQATDELPIKQSGYYNIIENLQQLAAKLSCNELIKIKQISIFQRRSTMYDIEKYCQIIQAELNYEQLIQSITLSFLVEKFKINYQSSVNLLQPIVVGKVYKEMCSRVLFSKEEIMVHLNTYPKINIHGHNLQALKFHQSPLTIIKKLLNDLVCQQTGIDEAEEYCFKQLFLDDKEVQESYQQKENYVKEIAQNVINY